MQAEWVAVDWGTSNVRAWGLNAKGVIVFARASDQGMGMLDRGAYPRVLSELIGPDPLPAGTEVLICGMAGARQGWREAPYLDVPADLAGLAAGAVAPEGVENRLAVRILPGLCQRQAGYEDVMRGEETQLLGLAALRPGFAGPVIMPGTHSKWALLDGTTVSRFSTAMTGELFALIRQHTVLRHSLAKVDDPQAQAEGFAAGSAEGFDAPETLLNRLFRVRASSLLSGTADSWNAGYLSGLLIGAEIGGHRDWLSAGAEIPLIGGSALCSLYAQVLQRAGLRGTVIDATDATLAGLKAARY